MSSCATPRSDASSKAPPLPTRAVDGAFPPPMISAGNRNSPTLTSPVTSPFVTSSIRALPDEAEIAHGMSDLHEHGALGELTQLELARDLRAKGRVESLGEWAQRHPDERLNAIRRRPQLVFHPRARGECRLDLRSLPRRDDGRVRSADQPERCAVGERAFGFQHLALAQALGGGVDDLGGDVDVPVDDESESEAHHLFVAREPVDLGHSLELGARVVREIGQRQGRRKVDRALRDRLFFGRNDARRHQRLLDGKSTGRRRLGPQLGRRHLDDCRLTRKGRPNGRGREGRRYRHDHGWLRRGELEARARHDLVVVVFARHDCARVRDRHRRDGILGGAPRIEKACVSLRTAGYARGRRLLRHALEHFANGRLDRRSRRELDGRECVRLRHRAHRDLRTLLDRDVGYRRSQEIVDATRRYVVRRDGRRRRERPRDVYGVLRDPLRQLGRRAREEQRALVVLGFPGCLRRSAQPHDGVDALVAIPKRRRGLEGPRNVLDVRLVRGRDAGHVRAPNSTRRRHRTRRRARRRTAASRVHRRRPR